MDLVSSKAVQTCYSLLLITMVFLETCIYCCQETLNPLDSYTPAIFNVMGSVKVVRLFCKELLSWSMKVVRTMIGNIRIRHVYIQVFFTLVMILIFCFKAPGFQSSPIIAIIVVQIRKLITSMLLWICQLLRVRVYSFHMSLLSMVDNLFVPTKKKN